MDPLPPPYRIRVKFTPSDVKEVDISSVSPASTVLDLKAAIQQALGSGAVGADKYLRLIFNGKMLNPDTSPLSLFGLQPQSFVHAVIATRSAGRSSESAHAPTGTGTAGTAGASTGPRRGLDVLMNASPYGAPLSAEQVQAIRVYFQDSIREHGQQALGPRAAGEAEADYQLRSETEWMAAQGVVSEFRMNLSAMASEEQGDGEGGAGAEAEAEGGWRELVWGFLLGYLLGIVAVFCVWDRRVSQRQKLGIVLGVSAHILSTSSGVAQARGQQQDGGGGNREIVVGGGSGPSLRGTGGAVR